MIYRNVRQKSLGCLRIERNTNILGRPATGRVTSRRIVPESAKRHPNSCDKVARLRSYEIRVGLRTRSLLTAVMVHTGCENSMAETESRSMIVRMVTNHPVIIVLQLRGSRLCESNLRIGPYHLVDNVLGPAGNVA